MCVTLNDFTRQFDAYLVALQESQSSTEDLIQLKAELEATWADLIFQDLSREARVSIVQHVFLRMSETIQSLTAGEPEEE